MGTQQVSGLFCARTEIEGKGAGYLSCSPEVPGTGGLRMLSNNPLLLDNGGDSSCIQGILNMKFAETMHTGRSKSTMNDGFALEQQNLAEIHINNNPLLAPYQQY